MTRQQLRDFLALGTGALVAIVGAAILLGFILPGQDRTPAPPIPTEAYAQPNTSVPNGTTAKTPIPPPVDSPRPSVGLGSLAKGTYVSLAGIQRVNPRTPVQAVATAIAEVKHPTRNFHNLCEGSTAWFYGWGYSGYYSALAHAMDVPRHLRHRIPAGNRHIPLGALIYFPVGTYGHVVMAVGYAADGETLVSSNDIRRDGRIDIVRLSVFRTEWGMIPAFWAPPNFPPAGGRNPNKVPKIVKADPLAAVVARPRTRSAAVPTLKARLRVRNRSTFYGRSLTRKVVKWQAAHHYPRNGVVTRRQYLQIKAG